MALVSALAAPMVQAAPPADQGHPHASQAPVPDHSVSGVVKTIDKTRLVITRPGKTPVEMTFGVDASTQKEGSIAAGTKVQVRFRGDGHGGRPAIATAILVAPPAHHVK